MTIASLQHVRHANLKLLIDQLHADGVNGENEQAQLLGNLRARELTSLLKGAPISDALARELEWAMHRPRYWMDLTHDQLTVG